MSMTQKIHREVEKELKAKRIAKWAETCSGYMCLNKKEKYLILSAFESENTPENFHFAIWSGLYDLIPALLALGASKTATFTYVDKDGNIVYENWTALKLAEFIIPNTFEGKKKLLEILA